MSTIEAISYLLGQLVAASVGFAIGNEYGAAVGFSAWGVLSCLVDIRTRIQPYWKK